ncbi:MAG TPA: DinB family protein [Puia sp.]|nr:DinB family protein [Puia sp.]
MDKPFKIIRNTRKFLLNHIADLTVDELNEIPRGFNNNIVWNIGHMIAAQQNVTYVRAGHKVVVDEAFFLAHKPDTRPQQTFSAAEVAGTKDLFFSTIDRFESDYQKGLFSNYTPWTNRYGVELNTIGEVLAFLPYHEGLHLGYVMALKRIVVGARRPIA